MGLPAIGLAATTLLLPQSYPADGRIFATGENALQVSHDGGQTFVPLTLSVGTAAMSPGFSTGDPRIFLADAPGRQYDDSLGATTPLELTPSAANASNSFSFAFPTAYDVAKPLMFVGGSTVGGSSAGKVFRCVGTTCGMGVALEGVDAAPSLVTAPTASGDVLFAYQGAKVFRSTDGGLSFVRLTLPSTISGIAEVRADSTGGITLLGFNGKTVTSEIWRSADRGETWTATAIPDLANVKVNTVHALRGGVLVVGLEGFTSGLACTADNGRTWTPHC